MCFSANINIRLIKPRRRKRMRNVTNVRDKRNAVRVLVGKTEKKRPLEDLGINGRIILK